MLRCLQMRKQFSKEGGTMTSANETLDIEKIEEEINICESAIKGAKERTSTYRVSSMSYFWPFLLVSIPAFLGLWIYGEMNGLVMYFREGATAAEDFKATTLFLAILVFFLLHVFGGAIARHYRDRKNSELDLEEQKRKVMIKNCENRIVELKKIERNLRGESIKAALAKEKEQAMA